MNLNFSIRHTFLPSTRFDYNSEDSFFVDYFQEKNPGINVYHQLGKLSRKNSYIKQYLDTIKQSKSSTSKREKYNYKTVKENIEKKLMVPVPYMYIEELSKKDIKNLADDFLQEKDPVKQEKYLRVFERVKFPYDYQPILVIAKGRNSRSNRRVEFACKALRFFAAKEIREFAIQKLSKTNPSSTYLSLLVANYQKDDYKLLEKIVDRYKDEEIIHSLAWHYSAIYTANKTKESKRPLEIFYRKLTCGIHRCEIIEILHQNGVLSGTILKEMEFDSYEETRELYKRINQSAPKPSIQLSS